MNSVQNKRQFIISINGPEGSETGKSKVFAMEKLQLSHSVDCDILFCEFDSIFSVQDFVIIV